MVVKLEKVVPFGRTFTEYVQMFNLTDTDLNKSILGVGDGPASFNATATKKGYKITSVDPIYQLSASEIQQRFLEVVDSIIEQVTATPNDWVWTYHKSPQDLRKNREQALEIFLENYEQGKEQNRYKIGFLPKLDYQDKEYDLALCSHLLFLYSEHYDYQFHYESILEMLRVSQEVRIFPLLTLMAERSPYLAPLIKALEKQGYDVTIIEVKYQFQKGGNEMLVIKQPNLYYSEN